MKNLIVNADDVGWTEGVNRDAAPKKTATRLQELRQAELEILTDEGIRKLVASQGIRLIDYAFVAQEA